MAQITFPSVLLQEFRIDIQIPNVIRHNSIYTAKEQIFSRGNLFFAGRIGWARRDLSRIEEISDIEAFLISCYGPVNTFKIPVPRDQSDRFETSGNIQISSVTTDGTFESEFKSTKGLLVGDWVNFGTRLHKITYADDTDYKCVPGILNDETTLVWENVTLNARLSQDSVDLPRAGYFAGPWQVEVQEVL